MLLEIFVTLLLTKDKAEFDSINQAVEAYNQSLSRSQQKLAAAFDAAIEKVYKLTDTEMDQANRQKNVRELQDSKIKFLESGKIFVTPYMLGGWYEYQDVILTQSEKLRAALDPYMKKLQDTKQAPPAVIAELHTLVTERLQKGQAILKSQPGWEARMYGANRRFKRYMIAIADVTEKGFIAHVEEIGKNEWQFTGKFIGHTFEMKMTKLIKGEPNSMTYQGINAGDFFILYAIDTEKRKTPMFMTAPAKFGTPSK